MNISTGKSVGKEALITLLIGLIVLFSLFAGEKVLRAQATKTEGEKTLAQEFMSIEEVEKGMTGKGKTVVKGTELSPFDIKVIGIMDKPGYLQDFVVVRVSGKAIEESGGVAQGMSGSPIYIDGKLLGALSRAVSWSRNTENPIALITPIYAMLELLEGKEELTEKELQKKKEALRDGFKTLYEDANVELRDAPPSTEELKRFENKAFIYPLKTPVMVSGLGSNSLNALKAGIDITGRGEKNRVVRPLDRLSGFSGTETDVQKGLSGFDLSFHQLAGSAQAGGEALSLQPGGPMGVSLVSGDITIGALGTVTYKRNDYVLGFGHRFLLNGPSDFVLTRTKIFDTVSSYQSSFKLGSIGDSVGALVEDRTQGILGQLGGQVNLFDLNLQIDDKDRGVSRFFSVQEVKTPRLVGQLTLPVLIEAIDRSINRIGPGTVKFSYSIEGDNMPQTLERTDVFFSSSDVSILPSLQLAIFVNALANNPFQDPGLTRMSGQIEIQKEIKAGIITSLATDRKTYSPGDPLAYQVKVKNYRDNITKKTGILSLPSDIPEGEYVLTVYGGPRPTEIAPPEDLQTFDDFIRYIESLKSYEHLSVELLDPLEEKIVPLSDTGYKYQSIKRTDELYPGRVIYGRKALSIIVEKEDKEK